MLIYVHYQQIHADDNLHTVVILVTKLHYVHNDFHKQVLGHILSSVHNRLIAHHKHALYNLVGVWVSMET